MGDMVRRKAEAAGPKLMAAMDRALPEEGTIHMEVRLTLEPVRDQITPRIRICLLIGEERLYVVKSIPQMIDAIDTQTPVEYGKGFVFHPEWMRFGTVQERILKDFCARCVWHRRKLARSLRGAEQRDLALPGAVRGGNPARADEHAVSPEGSGKRRLRSSLCAQGKSPCSSASPATCTA